MAPNKDARQLVHFLYGGIRKCFYVLLLFGAEPSNAASSGVGMRSGAGSSVQASERVGWEAVSDSFLPRERGQPEFVPESRKILVW
jgi:hypothetical protein